MGCCFLLLGIFLTQGSNLHLLCLLHWQTDSLPLCNLGSPLECFISVRYLKQIEWQNVETEKGWPVGMWVFLVLLCVSMYLKGIVVTDLQPASDHASAFPHQARTLIVVTLETRCFWWGGQWLKLSSCGSSELKSHTRQNPNVPLFSSPHVCRLLYLSKLTATVSKIQCSLALKVSAVCRKCSAISLCSVLLQFSDFQGRLLCGTAAPLLA